MTNVTPPKKTGGSHFQRYLILGVLTVIPLLITVWVIDVLLDVLAAFGRPVIVLLAKALKDTAPLISDILLDTAFQSVAAIILVILALYGLGLVSSQFLGRKLIQLVNAIMTRIPLVEKIYGSVSRMLEAFQKRPEDVQRVVLIEFPSPEMKAVGLVTKTLKEKGTGRELAAVFVPTTPNPTNGYLEVVPVERLVSLDWTVDDAISFVISGGAVGPNAMPYTRNKGGEKPPEEARRERAPRVEANELQEARWVSEGGNPGEAAGSGDTGRSGKGGGTAGEDRRE
ncbi:MAG: DUF502 domain-containing protein [Alphaproteobacteria bacterium]